MDACRAILTSCEAWRARRACRVSARQSSYSHDDRRGMVLSSTACRPTAAARSIPWRFARRSNRWSRNLPSPSNRNLYYWYYATLALQQNQHQSPEDTSSWESWNHALTTALIATQESDGSWDADTVWGGYGGKVYTTSLSALCLEVYYRYSPVQGPRELADREGWQSLQR